MYFVEKVKTAQENLETHKVFLKDSVGSNEGPWLVTEPVGVSSLVPRQGRIEFISVVSRIPDTWSDEV